MDLHRYIALSLTLWVFAIYDLKFLSCKFFCLPHEWRMDRAGRVRVFSDLLILVAGHLYF